MFEKSFVELILIIFWFTFRLALSLTWLLLTLPFFPWLLMLLTGESDEFFLAPVLFCILFDETVVVYLFPVRSLPVNEICKDDLFIFGSSVILSYRSVKSLIIWVSGILST